MSGVDAECVDRGSPTDTGGEALGGGVSTLSLLLLSSLAEVKPIEATAGSFVSPLGGSK
jgi:hypothetical protein